MQTTLKPAWRQYQYPIHRYRKPSPAGLPYWTVTEHDHNSKVQAGENAGEFLKHDFVVRQYTPAGDYKMSERVGDTVPQKLSFLQCAPTPGHARQVNLVVFDPKTGSTLQALSVQCAEVP
ncbi:DUF1223 domain-containing protein [Polaromonas sp. P1-6]|nr:DUF1223 domain-containing protein [Polaromonas sp. P1-6]